MSELEPGPFFFPSNIRSDQSRENWVAEIIRESAMVQLRQELPYTVAVQVLEWRDPEEGSDDHIYIMAEVWVERSNHRMMVLGKGGKMIREIGRNARKQLDIFLNHRIYLSSRSPYIRGGVKTPESLRELGYES
jgi:GTP-binding protein Era